MLPFHDAQFWLVTGAFVFAAWWICRGVLPRWAGGARAKGKRGAPGARRKVRLTINGRDAARERARDPMRESGDR